jgi:pimeloyl-ACP methyl ester carboxylesterase
MPQSKKFLFFHGGPGLNSFMEMGRLKPAMADRHAELFCWNEPSRLRSQEPTEYSFSGWMNSLLAVIREKAESGPIGVIGHSFGCIGAVHAAAALPSLVDSIVLLAPALDQFATQTRIAEIALRDYSEAGSVNAEVITRLLAQSRTCSDESMREALSLAAQDPKLLTHYWNSPQAMNESLSHLASPERQVDMESFFAVSEDYAKNHERDLSSLRPGQAAKVLFFREDQVSDEAAERQVMSKILPHAVIEVQKGLGHFGHLDDPERVAEWISKE